MCGLAGELRFDGRGADVGTVARMTALTPGASPPPVLMAMLRMRESVTLPGSP